MAVQGPSAAPQIAAAIEALSTHHRMLGGVDVMIDLGMNAWDAAPTQVLVPEAGGRCVSLPPRDGKLGLVFGSPALVDELLGFLSVRG